MAGKNWFQIKIEANTAKAEKRLRVLTLRVFETNKALMQQKKIMRDVAASAEASWRSLQRTNKALKDIQSSAHASQKALSVVKKELRDVAASTHASQKGMVVLKKELRETNQWLNRMYFQLNRMEQGMKSSGTQAEKTKKKFRGWGQVIRWVGLTAQRTFNDMGRFANKALRDVGKNIEVALTSVGTGLKKIGAGGLGGNVLSPLLDSIRKGATSIIGIVEKAFTGAMKAAASVVGGAGKLVGAAFQTVLTTVGTIAGQIFGGPFLGAVIGSGFGALFKGIADAAAGALEGVASVFAGLGSVISGVLTAAVNIAGQILNGLVSVAQKVVTGIAEAFGALVGKVAGVFGNVAGKATAVFAGMTAFAVRNIVKMDKRLATAFGLIPRAGEEAFAQLRAGVIQQLGDIPFIAGEQLSRGLFEAISAGAREPGRALEILSNSATVGAITGLTDINEVVRALTRTSAIFNEEIETTTDLLNQAQNLGQLTFQELARGVGLVAGISKTANVELKDLLEAVAAGSRVLDPESLFTGLRRGVQTLAAPTPDAAKARDRIGISFKTMNKEEKAGLAVIRDDILARKRQLKILIDLPRRTNAQRIAIRQMRAELSASEQDWKSLNKASGKFIGIMESIRRIAARGLNLAQIREIVPEIRATAVIQGIISLGDAVKDISKEMENFKGVTAEADAIMRQTFASQVSLAWNNFQVLVDGVWKTIEGDLIGVLEDLIGKMKELNKSGAFEGFKASVLGAVRAIGSGIVTAFDWITLNWPSIESAVVDGFKNIQIVGLAVWNGIKAAYEGFRDSINAGGGAGALVKMWENVKRVAGEVWEIMKAMSEGDLGPLENAWQGLFAKMRAWAENVTDTIELGFTRAISGMVKFLAKMYREMNTPTTWLGKFAAKVGITGNKENLATEETTQYAKAGLRTIEKKGLEQASVGQLADMVAIAANDGVGFGGVKGPGRKDRAFYDDPEKGQRVVRLSEVDRESIRNAFDRGGVRDAIFEKKAFGEGLGPGYTGGGGLNDSPFIQNAFDGVGGLYTKEMLEGQAGATLVLEALLSEMQTRRDIATPFTGWTEDLDRHAEKIIAGNRMLSDEEKARAAAAEKVSEAIAVSTSGTMQSVKDLKVAVVTQLKALGPQGPTGQVGVTGPAGPDAEPERKAVFRPLSSATRGMVRIAKPPVDLGNLSDVFGRERDPEKIREQMMLNASSGERDKFTGEEGYGFQSPTPRFHSQGGVPSRDTGFRNRPLASARSSLRRGAGLITGAQAVAAQRAREIPVADRQGSINGVATQSINQRGNEIIYRASKEIEEAVRELIRKGVTVTQKKGVFFKTGRGGDSSPVRVPGGEQDYTAIGTRSELGAQRAAERASEVERAARSRVSDAIAREIEEREAWSKTMQDVAGDAEYLGSRLEDMGKAGAFAAAEQRKNAAEIVRGTGRKVGFAEKGDKRRLAFFEPGHGDRTAGRSVREGARIGGAFGASSRNERRSHAARQAARAAGLYSKKGVDEFGRSESEVRSRQFGNYGGQEVDRLNTREFGILKEKSPGLSRGYVRDRESELERKDFRKLQGQAKKLGLDIPLPELAQIVEENTDVDEQTGEEVRTSLITVIEAMVRMKETTLSNGQKTIDLLNQLRAEIDAIRNGLNREEQNKTEVGKVNGKGTPNNISGKGM